MWAKPDSTWSWILGAMPDGRTRLVTRLRQRYRAAPATLITVIQAEFGDYPMMRKMLLGIKSRAETARPTGVASGDGERGTAGTAAVQ